MGYANALALLPTKASCPSADTLFRLGLRLSTPGEGTVRDPVAAHVLFELAARLGSIEAKVYRRDLTHEMDPGEVDEAREIAREWLAGG